MDGIDQSRRSCIVLMPVNPVRDNLIQLAALRSPRKWLNRGKLRCQKLGSLIHYLFFLLALSVPLSMIGVFAIGRWVIGRVQSVEADPATKDGNAPAVKSDYLDRKIFHGLTHSLSPVRSIRDIMRDDFYREVLSAKRIELEYHSFYEPMGHFKDEEARAIILKDIFQNGWTGITDWEIHEDVLNVKVNWCFVG